jgi:hypothetical protein
VQLDATEIEQKFSFYEIWGCHYANKESLNLPRCDAVSITVRDVKERVYTLFDYQEGGTNLLRRGHNSSISRNLKATATTSQKHWCLLNNQRAIISQKSWILALASINLHRPWVFISLNNSTMYKTIPYWGVALRESWTGTTDLRQEQLSPVIDTAN